MATKKPPEVLEDIDAEVLTKDSSTTDGQDEVKPTAVFIGDRRQLIIHFVGQILASQKFDLDGKMPDQQQRQKIINFATKLADDVIAATIS